MLSLFIDTSYKYLTVAISKDKEIIASYCEECFKRQSEELFMVLDNLFKQNKLCKADISSVYITWGPGSYTGVRIALTLAKVYCSISKAKLYTISTLKLYVNGIEYKYETYDLSLPFSLRVYLPITNLFVMFPDSIYTLDIDKRP